MTELGFPGERSDVAVYLRAHGWETAGVTTAELFAAYGLEAPPVDDELQRPFGDISYLSATLR